MKVKAWALVLVLLAGNIIAWSTVFISYRAFFAAGGSLFQFSGCTVTNPLATPCFYGALAFLITFLWAGSLAMGTADAKSYRNLSWLLLASSIFGWGNVAYEIYGMQSAPTGAIIACGDKTVTSVFQSSCLYGTLAFTVGLVLSYMLYRKLKAPSQNIV